MPVFKIKFGEDTRRISLDRAPSFDELKQIVKQLFNIPQSFTLKYEDEEKDLITIASDSELNEALVVASKFFSNILRLSIIDRTQKTNEPQISPELFRSEFTKAVGVSGHDLSDLLSKFRALGIPQSPQQSGQQSLQVLSQLMTTFPWLNHTIAAMVKQNFQIPEPAQPPPPSQSIPNTPPSNVKVPPSPVQSPTNKKHRHMAKFIKDVSVPDGTTLTPESKFVKIWRVRNDGVACWPENTMLSYVGGDQLGISSMVSVPQVEAGQEIEISVPMLAPSLPGRYNSFWRLCGSDGSKFGHRMWADITVKAPQPVTEAPTQLVAEYQAQPVVEPQTQLVVEPQAQNEILNKSNRTLNNGSIDDLAYKDTTVTSNDNIVADNNNSSSTPNVDDSKTEASTTPAEAEALVTLVDMGFKGDLLSVLRKHGGDLMNTLGDLVTHR